MSNPRGDGCFGASFAFVVGGGIDVCGTVDSDGNITVSVSGDLLLGFYIGLPGPSAGISMTSALISLALNKPAKKGFAMTGEITLTGEVLAVGGIREKLVAAQRTGIKSIILPSANEGDVKELPKHITKGLKIHFAKRYDDVYKILF